MLKDISSEGKTFVTLLGITAYQVGIAIWMKWKRWQRCEAVGKVVGIFQYPVKSCKAIQLKAARCTYQGLYFDGLYDRHWMITQANGDFLTQRQFPKMALISTSSDGDKLYLDAPGMETLALPNNPPVDPSKIRSCRVWSDRIEALDCGDDAGAWVSQYLGTEGLRIVFSASYMPKRDINLEDRPWGNPAQPGDISAFSDWSSFMILTTASIHDLNERLKEPVTVENFRPNLLIENSFPFDEDEWDEIQIGDKVVLRCLDPCTRCVLTTVNPITGIKSPEGEPLNTLKKFRQFSKYGTSPCFGVNATPDVEGDIRVGDTVYAIKRN
ncbi:hypothetical protein CHS0354_040158 [Potamilus streckersoni]|uniref:MOSC domain-containing protein n=1 Tax=Potamilus streckersoni TaxID=2493646 RepID=A0AAE0W226_9BIVA|nr:hypothetical protein CHS0354_040158 [Potamilus streckersoni]